MTAVAFDIANPAQVAHELEEANRRLAKEPTVPASILAMVAELAEQISETSRDERAGAGVRPDEWIDVQAAALRALHVATLEDDERAQRRQLRGSIEELRFRLARLAEHEPLADERPIDEIVRWLDGVLTVPQATKAALFGVRDRTYQRWISETDSSRPSGDDERRVRLVARLVGDLRHLLTAVGVVGWLQRPHPALGQRRPLDLLDSSDPRELQQLFELVAAARAGAAA